MFNIFNKPYVCDKCSNVATLWAKKFKPTMVSKFSCDKCKTQFAGMYLPDWNIVQLKQTRYKIGLWYHYRQYIKFLPTENWIEIHKKWWQSKYG